MSLEELSPTEVFVKPPTTELGVCIIVMECLIELIIGTHGHGGKKPQLVLSPH